MSATEKYTRAVCRNMNYIMCGIFLLSCMLTACGVTPQTIREFVGTAPKCEVKALTVEEYPDENRPFSGMFFTSDAVVEAYEYDDAYCLLYSDPDSDMFEAEIYVDLETYQLVCQAVKEGRELVGTLVLNDDYSFDDVEVFTFMPEPEFEIANSSSEL